ncbi:hypothetical protein D3C81_1449830 [compost metagenome]
MVLEVLAHAGQVMHHGHAVPAQVRRRADAGRHQQLRRAERAGADDDLAARAQHHLGPIAPGQHAHRAAPFEQDPQHLRAGQHMQVRAPAVAGAVAHVAAVQVGARGVPALAVVLGHLVPAGALLLVAIEIVVAGQAGQFGGIDEMLAERVGRAEIADVEGAGAAVQRIVVVAGHAGVAFGAAEDGQDIVPRPAVAAGGGPAVVVGRAAPHIDHGVDRR